MASIRLIAVVALCVLATVAADVTLKEKLQKNMGRCAKVLRVPAEELERYYRGEFPEDHDSAHEAYCFQRCTGILNGSWDDSEGLVASTMFKTANLGKTEAEFNAMIEGCQPKEGDMANQCYCWRASKALRCAWNLYKEWEQTANAL